MYGCAFHVGNDVHVCSMKRGHGPDLCVLRRAERDRVGGAHMLCFALYLGNTRSIHKHLKEDISSLLATLVPFS